MIARLARQSTAILLRKCHRLLRNLSQGRVDCVEATHQLRVATRRADVALRIYGEWLPNRRRKWLRRVLQQVRAEAGTVRDLDLLAMNWLPTQDPAGVLVAPDVAAWLHTRIQQQRSDAWHRLLHWTRKSKATRLRKRSRTLVQSLRRRGHGTAADLVSQSLARLAEQLREALPFTSTSLPSSHRTRIHARRLRYALELLQEFLSEDILVIGEPLAQMQQQLGQVNDDATEIRFLEDAICACGDPHLAERLKPLLELASAAAEEHLAKWAVDSAGQLSSLIEVLDRIAPGRLADSKSLP